MEKLERKDWRPKQQPTLIDRELYHFICDTIGKLKVPLYYHTDVDHSCIALECSYGFTHLTFAASNAAKISGIKYNVLQSATWQDVILDYADEKDSKIITGRLDRVYKSACLSYLIPPNDEIRRTKGTFVALGKLIAALYPSLEQNEVSQAASKLADALRLRACPDTSIIDVSNFPSRVYRYCHSSHGSIGNSCMADKDSTMFELYDMVKDCSIIYIKENDVLIGRALVWKNVIDRKSNTVYTVMDRVYSDYAHNEAIFFQYARENNMLYKKNQSISCNDWIDCDHVLENPDLVVNCGDLINAGLKKVPYLDSFYNYHHANGLLSVDCTDNSDAADTYLRSTDGTDDNGLICRGIACSNCDHSIGDRDAMEHDGMIYCRDCFNELFFRCDNCNCVESIDHAVSVHTNSCELIWCQDCADRCAHQCDECYTLYKYDTDLIRTVDNVQFCEHCYQNPPQCMDCGDVYYDSDKIIDGMCMHCRDDNDQEENE